MGAWIKELPRFKTYEVRVKSVFNGVIEDEVYAVRTQSVEAAMKEACRQAKTWDGTDILEVEIVQ